MEKEYTKLGLKKEEYRQIIDFLGRKPNYLELSIYSVMWSEHCSYKSSRLQLKKFKTTGKYVLQGPGENAGALDIGDGQAIVFKIESHNHPSAVEPYQGAATGIGGIIRDIFAMGARPICSLNSLRFGRLGFSPRIKYLFENVVKGIGDYGNCMGIPTVGGEVYFDDLYEDNPLVNAMSVGIVEKDKLIRSKAFGDGNLLVLIGSNTGRDGIHGATFASDELDEKSEERRPSVQVGDPFAEKVLLEVCLELLDKKLILGLQDMGAAGITSSSVEMASKGDVGIEIEINKVPLREASMVPYEIMLSESQERMLALVSPDMFKDVKDVCDKWNINCSSIGKVNENSGDLDILKKGRTIGRIPIKTLTDEAPAYRHNATEPNYLEDLRSDGMDILSLKEAEEENTLQDVFRYMIGLENISSKKWVWEQYDHMVQTNTVVLPGHDSAVIRVKDKNKALSFSCDGNGRYCYIDPYTGGIIAVAESCRNLVCTGAEPIGITDCLNFGTPEKPGIFWQFEKCIDGMNAALEKLDVPIVSGNVSFYNESFGKAIYPTPVVGSAGLIKDLNDVTSMGFKSEGDKIILIGKNLPHMGGSEIVNAYLNRLGSECPEIDIDYEKSVQDATLSLIRKGLVKSAHDCSIGGLGICILKSCISGQKGASINIEVLEESMLITLFNESQSRIVISTDDKDVPAIEKLLKDNSIDYDIIGEVNGDILKINDLDIIKIEEARDLYTDTLGCMMAADK